METATAESFSPKQNGSTYCSINNIQSKFDPEDDFGPETNIDNIDDGLLSQPVSTKKSFTNFESLTNNGFDAEPQNNNAPGIKEADINVADEKDALSDDSDDEDEWNYFEGKGNSNSKPNNFQNSQPAEDNMSGQEVDYALNPDAAEFVPVSPVSVKSNEDTDSTSAFATFAPEVRERLLNDDWVASSPQKGHEKSMENVVVPDQNDFDKEIRKRPSNIMPDSAGNESFEIDGDFCPLKTNDTSLECPAIDDTCTSTNAVFGDESSYAKNLDDLNAELPEKTDDGDEITPIKPDHTTDVHDKIIENGDVFDNEDYPSIIEREPIETNANSGFNDVSCDRNSTSKDINFDDISNIIEDDTETTMRNMMTFSEEVPSHSIVYIGGQPTVKVNSRNASPIDDLLYANNNKNSNPFAVSTEIEKENAEEKENSEEKEFDFCQNDGKVEEEDAAQSTQQDFVDFTNEREVRADVHSHNAFLDLDTKEESKDALLSEHDVESEIESTHVDDIAAVPPCSSEVIAEVEANQPANVEPESGAEPNDASIEILSSQIVDPATVDADSFDPQDANVTSSSGVVGQTEAPTTQYDAETPYKHDCSRMNEKPDSVHHEPVQTKHYEDLLPDSEQSNVEDPPATEYDAETPFLHDCTRMNEKTDSVHDEPVEVKHCDDLLPDFDTTSTMESDKLESELRETQVKPGHPDISQFSSSFADIADFDPSSSIADARAADTDFVGLTSTPSVHDAIGDEASPDHVELADTSTPSAPPATDLFESKESEQSSAETAVPPAPEAVAALVGATGAAVAAPLLAAAAVAEVKKEVKKSVIKKPDEKAKPSPTKPPAKATPPAKPKPATATSRVSAEPRKMSTTMATKTAPVKSSLSAATRPAAALPKTTTAATRTTAAPTRTSLAAKPASMSVSKPLAAKPSSPAKTRPLSTTTAAAKPLSNGDVSKPLTARKIAPSTTAPKKTVTAATPTDATRSSVNMKTRTSLAPPPRPAAAMSDKSKLSASMVTKRPVSAPSKVINKDSKDLTNKRLSAGKSSPLKTSATTNGKTESKVSSALRSTTAKPSAGSTSAVAVRKLAPAAAVSVNVNQSEVIEHQN